MAKGRQARGMKYLVPSTCLAAAMSHCTFMKNQEGLHKSSDVQQWQGNPCPASGEPLHPMECTAQCFKLTTLDSVWQSFHGAA